MKKGLLKFLLLSMTAMMLSAGCGKKEEPEGPAARTALNSGKSGDNATDDEDSKEKKKEQLKKSKDEESNPENGDEVGPEPDEEYGDNHCNENYVYVSNVDELINNIESNTTIILEPGTYNLTEWAKKNSMYKDAKGEEVFVTPHVSLYDAYDGPQVKINYVNNLNIYSYSDWDEVEIVCEPRYAYVLEFDNCANVNMFSMTMGHTPDQGYCTGAVIGLSDCENMTFELMDLYGCGTYGIEANSCNQIMLDECDIHDCSYGCLDLYYTRGVTCNKVGFYDCAEAFSAFSMWESGLDLKACTFNNLPKVIVSADSTSYVRFLNCAFDSKAYEAVTSEVADGLPILLQVSEDQ